MVIYKITNNLNCKAYIGQTRQNPKLRWYQHKYKSNKNIENSILYKAFKKYGLENFSFEVICSTKTKDNLNYLEEYFIEHYNTRNNGYNILIGGTGNVPIGIKIEKRPYGYKISKKLKGKKKSFESCQKRSISMKEFYKNNNHSQSKKVICLTTGKIFQNTKEASIQFGCSSTFIQLLCKNKRFSKIINIKYLGELDLA